MHTALHDQWHCCCVIPGVGHSITAWSLVTGCRLSRLISTKYLCISTRTLSSSPISHDTPQPGTKLWLNYPLRDSIISRVYQYSVFLSGLAAHHQRWSGAREILVGYNLGICFPSRLCRRLGPMKDNQCSCDAHWLAVSVEPTHLASSARHFK